MSEEGMLTPQQAVMRWLVHGLDQDKVLPRTGYRSMYALYDAYMQDQANFQAAKSDLMMSPEERVREDDVAEVWEVFGDYLREHSHPAEYADEVRRLIPLIKKRQQSRRETASKSFGRRQCN